MTFTFIYAHVIVSYVSGGLAMEKRITYIDTTKGVLIMLIILGHIFFKSKFMFFAYTFHLSSFLIITGILFHHKDKTNLPFKVILKNAFYTLVIPFVFFETIGGIIKAIKNNSLTLFQLIAFPLKGACHVSSDWYLQTAFISELLFIGIEKRILDKRIKIVAYVLFYVLGFFLPREPFRFVLVSRVLIATSIIAAGYYIYDTYMAFDKRLLIASFIVTGLCTILNGYVSLYSITIGNPFLYIVGVISGAYFCISLCRLLPNKPLSFFGKNSLILMGTHEHLITYIPAKGFLLFSLIVIAEIPIILCINWFLPFCIGVKVKK